MAHAEIRVDPAFAVGEVRRRLFGSFVEHMGRCVYTGIHEPEHPTADEHGFRQDVAALVRELGATVVRYPGGNFVSGYRWEDGVGDPAERPTVLDLAWRSVETNQVGTDEFLAWCERLELEPMMAVNLGTRGLPEAVELLQYVTSPTGTRPADQRAAHGREKPYDVRLWCLGNEMDGPWQIGHSTAEEYARKAEETAKAMLRVEPGLELVACGSSNRGMPTFGSWERAVLERCFDHVDHISAHAYYQPDGDDDEALQTFLASGEDMQRFISAVVATADHVAAVRRSDKRITVSFDEWNVWYQHRFGGEASLEVRHAPHLIEDTYSLLDAVVVGDLLITLLLNTDRVAVACQAQLVNVIAPIRTEPVADGGRAWRQSIFHPFALTAQHATGTVLRPALRSPSVAAGGLGAVDAITVAVTHDPDAGTAAVFLVNRSLHESADVELDLARLGDGALELLEHLQLAGTDPHVVNTADDPDRVVPRPGDAVVRDGTVRLTAPAVSWHCLRLATTTRTQPAPQP